MSLCKVCHHPARYQIEKRIVEGASLRGIGREFGVTLQSIMRHRDNGHLARSLASTEDGRALADPGTLTAQVRGLMLRLDNLLRRAEREKDDKLFLSAANAIRPVYELLAKLLGELQSGQAVNVNFVASPDFSHLRACIIDALAEYPEARSRVAASLMSLQERPTAGAGEISEREGEGRALACR